MSDEQATDYPWEKIKDKPYCDPSKRMDFVLIFDVKDGNPNGDPDAGNLPRMDPATRHGIVTDVCIKRKIRDYLAAVLGRSIYIQSRDALNTLYFRAARKIVEEGETMAQDPPDDEKKRRQAEKEAVETLLAELDEQNDAFKELIKVPEEDIDKPVSDTQNGNEAQTFRTWLASITANVDGMDFDPEGGTIRYLGEAKSPKDFQALLSQDDFGPEPFKKQIGDLAKLLSKAKPAKSTKQRSGREVIKVKMCKLYDDIRLFGAVLTAGTNAGQIRGPMQLTFARSIETILQMDAAITRCAITREADRARKETEFGRKPWLSYAVYRQHGFFNPLLAEQTGLERKDLARFWEAAASMFPNSASASKGEMATQELVVFVHDNARGNWPSHKLLNHVKIERTGAESTEREFEKQWQVKVEGWDRGTSEPEDKGKWPEGVRVYEPLKDLWTTR